MHLVGNIISSNKDIGLKIAKLGVIKAAFILVSTDPSNARAYLKFIELIQEVMEEEEKKGDSKFTICVFKLAANTLMKNGTETKSAKNHQVATQCIRMLERALNVLGNRAKDIYDEVSKEINENYEEIVEFREIKGIFISNEMHSSEFKKYESRRKIIMSFKSKYLSKRVNISFIFF